MSRPVLFLDESGDHNLFKIDPEYPVFVLGGCIMDLEYHQKVASDLLNRLKMQFFGTKEVIIHTADIIRAKEPFHILTDSAVREKFFAAINSLMRTLKYTIVACVIRKKEHFEKYGLAAYDPYEFSLSVLIERFYFYHKDITATEKALVVAESRNETLDNELRLAWMRVRIGGTRYISPSEVLGRVEDLVIRPKSQNIAGLQIADLIVSPIGRFVIGKKMHEDWEIIKKKFRRGPYGEMLGYGLVIIP